MYTDAASYAGVFGGAESATFDRGAHPHLFDYQQHVTDVALSRKRYAAFLDCGLGKTAIEMAWCHEVARHGKVLILCPLAVLEDIQRFCDRFYGYRMSNLRHEQWTTDVAILNWESRRDMSSVRLAGICLDESSILKNDAGKIRKWLTSMAAGVPFRLACSATPTPNDQAEYGTHAVWLGYVSSLSEFYGRFFVKPDKDWRLKGHAVGPFYTFLSSWAVYMQKPSAMGFADTQAEMPTEPRYHVIDTDAPTYPVVGSDLFGAAIGLKDARVVFGALRSDTSQPRFTDSCERVAGRRSIVWASRNAEEQAFFRELGGHLVTGTTPIEERVDKIDDFRSGRVSTLVSKPSILGFGVNLPEAEAVLYSGYTWSFEQFYQAVRRAHRFGRHGRLDVIVPVTPQERSVWDSIRRKAATFAEDVAQLQDRWKGTAGAVTS